jgi:hypothetical protein
MKPELKNVKFGGIYHPLEKEFETSHDDAKFIPKQKKRTPEKPFTTEHQTIVSRTTGLPHEISLGMPGRGRVPKNPFASAAQRGYLHAHPEVLGKKALAEWDRASKGQKVPYHVKKKKGK